MSIHVGIEHRTTYRFDRAVSLAPHIVRLRPAPHCRTPILAYSLTVTPAEHFVNWQQDPFGNYLARFVFPEKATELEVVVDLIADMTVINPFDFFIDEYAGNFPFVYEPSLLSDLAPYLGRSDDDGPFDAWVATLPDYRVTEMATIDAIVALNRAVQQAVAYSIRMEPGVQTPGETLVRGIGSCRDSAWLLVQLFRRFGLAARFASGYLVQLTADAPSLDGPSGPTEDFTDLHAWTEVYVPGAGWIGLDPTSGLFAGEGHIPLACTPNPSSAAPIAGLVDPCVTEFSFSNRVSRVSEDPRVTRPYTDGQWHAIDALGQHVDSLLNAGDVRLTMGGEPTFVSVDDMESPQWTVDADGVEKRERAGALARQLASLFAKGGVLHHGQGKWYPGEPLPRWQIALAWRTDGVALWHDPALLADPSSAGKFGADDAQRLAHAIAVGLGVEPSMCVPAFEDPLVRLLAEARLPLGEPAHNSVTSDDLAGIDSDARLGIVRSLDGERGDAAAVLIPLHRTANGEWATTRWTLRRGALYLLPGDSPAGLRLPLDAITWSPAPPDPERSPYESRSALPSALDDSLAVPPARIVPVEDAPTTALAVQARNGGVFVFLPPLAAVDDAVALLAIVESAAAEAGVPVVLEGYAFARDERVQQLVITPDPGVLEVNVHPAASWDELVHITETVHREARLARLATETFQLDGTHSGTGGGNHITLGAARAVDSPMLRRPDLLPSLLTFWQHHPSLSYLFSGRFIGPTSQSPRVDEGRVENLYELEIAFAELARLESDASMVVESPAEAETETDDFDANTTDEPTRGVRPWQVDRLLRHLLTDVTGNTHRSEFCIDKLFSPDTERGRLGLLELRGFEMPPHPQMALVQGLLVRALVARCWAEPYKGALVRWGSELHDRFLLPHYVAADSAEVAADLRAHGIDFDVAWLAPFLEFRFPRIGEVTLGDVSLELRSAIEPWHVLGEEVSGTGTARYVDSSVERIQVRVTGIIAERHLVTCNGAAVPLRPTGVPGEAVAGVRFKAWKPPSALHPTMEVHGPLVFDVIDGWSRRSIGGCTYRVSHPGGRNYESFPVNANEAEARRRVRFDVIGHTPGVLDEVAVEKLMAGRSDSGRGPEYPRTLDLRRSSA